MLRKRERANFLRLWESKARNCHNLARVAVAGPRGESEHFGKSMLSTIESGQAAEGTQARLRGHGIARPTYRPVTCKSGE
jgi:hypothetical protein